MRRVAWVIAATLLVSTLGVGTVSAKQAPRLPTGAADWATFTAAEQQAAIDYERQLLDEGLRNGTVATQSVLAPAALSALAPLTATASASGACGFHVRNVSGGRWIAGGGYTDATDYMQDIYASRSVKQGQLFRDRSVPSSGGI